MKKYQSFSIFFLILALMVSLASPVLASEPTNIVSHAEGPIAPLAEGPVEDGFWVTATAAILLDADYNEVLWEYNADELRYPASITKVMTGLLTVEAVERGELSLDTAVTLGEDLYTGIGSGGSTQDLKTGEIMTVRDLLYCALLPSANEACNALAGAVSGSIPAFVERMNTRAEELGMTNTHFTNTHGYHDDSHYTTARDVATMCLEAMKHPDFRMVVSSSSYTIPETYDAEGKLVHKAREVIDTNALMTSRKTNRSDLLYKYAIGIKTGSTPEAGLCLAAAAEKSGRTMISVLLGGKYYTSQGEFVEDNYFSESKRMLEYGFNHFSRKTILDVIEPIATIPVSLCAEQNYVTVQPAQGIEATLPAGVDPADFERTITLPEELQAPIQKGQVLGTMNISYRGRDFGTVDLIATTSLERSQLLYTWSRVRFWFDKLWVKLLLLAVVLLILFFVLRRALLGPSSGRRNRRKGNQPRVYSSNYRGRRR